MPLDRPVVFPLLPLTKEGACTCSLGPACSRPGHHPAVLWRLVESGSAVPPPAEGAGYGVKTGAWPRGSGVIVIDIDSAEGLELLVMMGPLPDTYTVRSARGLHLYYEHPGFFVRNSVSALCKGVDIRGDGGFVTGPGSPHKSGAVYSVARDCAPAPAPQWLIDWLRKQPAQAEAQPHPEDVTGEERERRRELYGNWLASEAPVCRSGMGGDQVLFSVVQRGAYDLALPTEDVLELIVEHYDHRCEPPWGNELEARVLHKADDAKNRSTKPRDVPFTLEEEADLAAFFEPTTLAEPEPEPTEENDYGFKVQWGGWGEDPIPPNYLVDNLLVEEKVSMIFAEPGTIKTWLAMDIASAVSSGQSWLGERRVEKGRVLYVDFEDGRYEFHRRICMLTGQANRADLGYVYAPGNITEQSWWINLEKFVLKNNVKLVVIDTLAGATPGVDENDRNAADPLTYAGRLTETAKVTLLFLHHANRAGDIRGTSAFKATVDTLFKLESVEDNTEEGMHRAKLTCVKSGQKKVFPVYLELTDDGLRTYEPVKESKDEGEEKKQRTRTELEREILLLIESEGPIASTDTIRDIVKGRMATVTTAVAELKASGRIYKSPEGWLRDNEGQRRVRLKQAVREHGDWGVRALLTAAAVPVEFFDKCERENLLGEAVKGDRDSGFVWKEST